MDRGKGIYQPAVDQALEILNRNGWFHVFSEGKVNQKFNLIPFRWGVGRLIMEAKVPPLVICFYHTGLHEVMPEPDIPSIFRLPRINKRISCRFGQVIDSLDLINSSKGLNPEEQRSFITDAIFKETDNLRILSFKSN